MKWVFAAMAGVACVVFAAAGEWAFTFWVAKDICFTTAALFFIGMVWLMTRPRGW